MKRIMAALALVSAGVVSASAADLPTRSAPVYVPPPPPPPMWTGPYVGGFLGGSFGGDPGNSTGGDKVLLCVDGGCSGRSPGYGAFGGPGATSSSSSSDTSFAGGLQAGYNYQFNGSSFVLGGVIDFTWLNRSGSRYAESAASPVPQSMYDELSFYRDSFSQDWLATARIKAGVALDNLLIYATGGLAWGNLKSSSSSETIWRYMDTVEPVAFGSGSSSSTAFGWAAGAGLEYRFAPNWSLFAEYLYYSLDDSYSVSVRSVLGQTSPFTPYDYRVKVDGSGSLIKVGVNYQFWTPAAPVIAPTVVSVRN